MINRDETYIIDIEKEQYLIAKKVKQFDTVFLKYKLYKDSKELNLTGVNLNIKIAKPDKTFIEQTNNYTIENNTISINLNKFATNIPGNCLIDIVIKKSNTQITTFTTTLDIKSSNYYKNVDPKNIVTVLEDLDSSINLAQDRVNNLDVRNNTATTNINNLDARNNIATTKIRDLDSRNATATTNINNLDTKNNEAVTNKNSLYTENSVAQMHLDELKKKTEAATNTKEELNQFINNNKDMSKIHERINNNAKEITNLKDSIAQNRPIVIAEDTPIGSIVWYASEKILGKVDPDVWRVCNGQTLNKADFPDLYDLIKDNPNYTKTETTFNLPDLLTSKRFIRSVDDTYNVGKIESDGIKNHTHYMNSYSTIHQITYGDGWKRQSADGTQQLDWYPYEDNVTSRMIGGGDETRPKNIQFIPLIKCKCRAKDIVDLATDVEQAKAGFNTLKEAMDSKATKESIAEITEKISNAEETILDINNELEEARNGEVSLDARIERDVNKINDNIDNLSFLPFENENIYIDNSLNGYTRDLVIKGKTLHNIRIGEDIQNPGYTVWTKVSDNEYNAVGTTEQKGNGGLILSARTLFKPNTKYSLIFEYTASGVAGGEIRPDVHASYNAATTTVHNIQNGNRVIKLNFSTKADIAERRCKIALSEFVGTMNIKNIMVLEEIDYIPKYFEGIKSAGELEDNRISILSHGKNLFNATISESWQCNYTVEGQEISIIPTVITPGEVSYVTTSPIKLAIGKTYTVSCEFNEDAAYFFVWKSGTTLQVNKTFTADNNVNEIQIGLYVKNDNLNRKAKYKVQVSESNQDSKFEPYKEDKKDILLPFTDGLKSLPNEVSDEIKSINKENKLIENIIKFTLDGTEGWAYSNQNQPNSVNTTRYTLELQTIFNTEIKNSLSIDIINNKFQPSRESTWDNDVEGIQIKANAIYIRINKNKLSEDSVSGFKLKLREWFNSGNPLTIYANRKVPIIYDLDKNLNLEVYKDKTYISSNNSIQPVISCKAPTDVQATISTLRQNNKELEEENIKLKNNLSEYASKLEDSNLEMLKQNIDTDFRLMELEFALDL